MGKSRKKYGFAIILLIVAFVLTSTIISLGNGLWQNATAYNSSSAVPQSIGSLTLDDYDTRADGKVFDGIVLSKLYDILSGSTNGSYASAYTAVKGSQSITMGSVQNTTNPAGLSKNTQEHSMNYTDIKSRNSNTAVTVEFGGYKWNVVYATTNTTGHETAGDGDLIITLWMSEEVANINGADTAPNKVKWNDFSTTTTNGTYSSVEYSTSKIRVKTLNGGPKDGSDTLYATNISTDSSATAANRATNQFAKFTLTNAALTAHGANSTNGNMSLVDYLTTPNQVIYQKAESYVWTYNASGNPHLLLNEAWGEGGDSAHLTGDGVNGPDTDARHTRGDHTGGWLTNNGADTNNMTQVIDNPTYYNWAAEDHLWLPSLVELGYYAGNDNCGASIWGIPNYMHDMGTSISGIDNICDSASNIWVRSSSRDSAATASTLAATGYGSSSATTGVNVIRPALHLNLGAIARSASAIQNNVLPLPGSVTTTFDPNNSYNETNVRDLISAASWYDELSFGASVVSISNTVRYRLSSSAGWTTLDIRNSSKKYIHNAGEYELTLSIINFATDTSTPPDLNKDMGASYKGKPTARWRAGVTAGDEEDNGITSTEQSVKITVIINKMELDTPAAENDTQEYNGGNNVEFGFLYDSDVYTLNLPTGVTEGTNKLIATEVDEYEIKAKLKDKINYKWKELNDGEDEISFFIEVISKKLSATIAIYGQPGETTITGVKTSKPKVSLQFTDRPHADKTATVIIYAVTDVNGRPASFAVGTTTLTSNTYTATVTLSLTSLLENKTYELVAMTDDKSTTDDSKSYEIVQSGDITLDVIEDHRNLLIWQLSNDGADVIGTYLELDIDNDDDSVVWSDFSSDVIYYNGKVYSFNLILPKGYQYDTYYGPMGLETELKTSDPLWGGDAIDADTYVSTAHLIDKAGNAVAFTLEWTIEKGKFDLSKVKWDGNGQIEYVQTGATVGLDSKTVPKELNVVYDTLSDLIGYGVGDSGTATIKEFTFADPDMAKNYILPDKNDRDTYICNDDNGDPIDFAWDMDWTVVKATIKINWDHGSYYDKNGTEFIAYVLKDDKGVVDYYFYETDASGNLVDPSGATFYTANQLELIENEHKYYKVKPVLKNVSAEANFNLEDTMSRHFLFGEFSESLVVALGNETAQFTGKPFAPQINVTTGSINVNTLILAYYDRSGNALDAVPTKVGQYRLEIAIPAGGKYNFDTTAMNVQGGKAYFDFEITPKVVDNSEWNNAVNPPYLKNAVFLDMSGISYEYQTADGTDITYADIVKGNSYKIRAVISDTENFIFKNADTTGDFYATDWVEFTVNENDTLYNPMDPNNPYYPQNPDGTGSNPNNPNNPNNPGDNGNNGGGSSVADFFNKLLYEDHFPLWQVIVIAVSALLAIIFIVKAAQYGSRAKKANADAKKLNAKTYASLLPVFSTEVVAGLANKIWSIMAFAFIGFAVAMLIVALIMRSSWKKAELAKEAAAEDSEKRKAEAQEAKQMALQEKLISAQVGAAGMAGVAAAAPAAAVSNDASLALIEQMRRDMEAREERYRREEQERREEAARREEKERREEAARREEQARRDEAQAKRDDAMRMMIAKMMGHNPNEEESYGYASMDDTDLLVQRVIAGLLPAMQEMIPEATAYLNAPEEQAEELMAIVEEQKAMMEEQKAIVEEQRAIVEEQNEEIRNMAEAHNEEVLNLTEAHNEELRNITETYNEEMLNLTEQHIKEMRDMAEVYNSDMQAMTEQMNQLQQQLQMLAIANEKRDSLLLTDGADDRMAEMADTMQQQLEKIEELQAQLSAMEQDRADTVVLPDNSDDMKAMAEAMQQQLAKIDELQAQLAERPQTITNTVYVEREAEDDDDDEGEEWDTVIDEEDDSADAVAVDADGSERKALPNFRLRLKESSDKNREWYAAIKNLFCSQKGITYRVYKRVEKIRYQGQVIAAIGIAKRSIKLWLALRPYEFDENRYHHKDVSAKSSFVEVPMYVRVGSDRALTRAEELILALFKEQGTEQRKRYTDRSIQELIFTLKHNRLLTNKDYKNALCESIHVHDCSILDNETAEKCIESKNVDFIDESVIEQVKLDDIDANFLDGNRITLEKLKKVGLVSAECTCYTVTAGQRLTKPFIIVANDFTLEAVKMITLTGGRVVRLTAVNL